MPTLHLGVRSDVKPLSLALVCAALVHSAAFASVSVTRADRPKTLNVSIVGEPLSTAVKSLEFYLPHPIELANDKDPEVTFRARHVTAEAALHAMALEAGMKVEERDDRFVVSNPHEPTVTLDVKDADVHDFLKPMAEQCGIRNLVIDPDVHGSGTFLFRGVPCRVAFETVFRSTGLSSIIYPNSVVAVSAKH